MLTAVLEITKLVAAVDLATRVIHMTDVANMNVYQIPNVLIHWHVEMKNV